MAYFRVTKIVSNVPAKIAELTVLPPAVSGKLKNCSEFVGSFSFRVII